jgi:membrane fusion protein (multidrug efflux system)
MQKRISHRKLPKAGVTILSGLRTRTIGAGSFSMIVVTAMFMVLFTGCSEKQTKNQEVPEKENNELIVSTKVAKSITYSPQLQLTGSVFANLEANLGAGFPGKIEKIYYPEGTSVKEGQLLVEMSGEMMAQAETEYLTLKKDYERVSRLVQNGSVSQQEYDHVKARFDATTAKYELAKKNTRIRAPFSGVIVDYMAKEGENYFLNFNFEPGYSNTSGIVRLMQLNPVKVQVDVNEKDLAQIGPGLKANIEVDAFPGEVFKGKISLIKPYLSTRSRTSEVEITIPNHDMRLKPGMFARVSIQLGEKSDVFVPIEALYRDPETDTEKIYVVKNNLAKARTVQRIGGLGEMLVVAGINEGDEVITGGKNRVQEGTKVKILNKGGN